MLFRRRCFWLLQALIGFVVLISFNAFTIGLGIASLTIVAVYPFMKRITYWPQIVLGLAFSWGALMGWAAAFGRLDLPALLLYAGSIAWVIGYDTIYAHQDRDDDALIGIKSTALLFGERTKPMLGVFYGRRYAPRRGRFCRRRRSRSSRLGLLAFAAHLAWQIVRLDIADPDRCLALFKSNRDAGSDPVCRIVARRGAAPFDLIVRAPIATCTPVTTCSARFQCAE